MCGVLHMSKGFTGSFVLLDTCVVQPRAQWKIKDIRLRNCGTLEAGRLSAASFWQLVTKLFG